MSTSQQHQSPRTEVLQSLETMDKSHELDKQFDLFDRRSETVQIEVVVQFIWIVLVQQVHLCLGTVQPQ